MKAKQYLYTSYRNAPNGGFSVYSFTPGLSADDQKAITTIMQYPSAQMSSDYRRKTNNLTWNPVDIKEIDGFTPRNFAYFLLPSGQYCIAETGYIGPEFKGFTPSGRTGNYLLHALVFDSPLPTFAIYYLGSAIFRHDLTLAEWTASKPAPLTEIDLPNVAAGISQQELTAFFSVGDRKVRLGQMINGLVHPLPNQTSLFLNDEEKNIRYWLYALECYFGVSKSAQISFNTYSYDDVNSKIGLPPVSKLKIQVITGSTARVKLTQKTMMNPVFDFVDNYFSNNLTSDSMIELGVSFILEDAVHAVDNLARMESLMNQFHVDLEMAKKIDHMERKGISDYSISELLSLLDVYAKGGSITRFGDEVYQNFVSGKYVFSNESYTLLNRFVSSYDENKANDLASRLFASFASKASGDPLAYANSVKAAVPSFYSRYGKLMAGDVNFVNTNINNDAAVYLYFDCVVSNGLNEDIKNRILALLPRYFTSNNSKMSEALLAKLDMEGKQKALTAEADRVKNSNNLPYIQSLLTRITSANYLANYLYNLILAYPNKREIVAFYNKNFGSNPMMSKVDSAIRGQAEMMAIFEKLEVEDFANATSLTFDQMSHFYRSYYLTNKDTNNDFVRQFSKRYCNPNAALRQEVSSWMDIFLATPVKENDKKIYSYFLAFFPFDFQSPVCVFEREYQKLERFGFVSEEYHAFVFHNTYFKLSEGEYRNALRSSESFFASLPNDNQLKRKDFFYTHYLVAHINKILSFNTTSYLSDANLFSSFCTPFVSSNYNHQSFKDEFYQYVTRLPNKQKLLALLYIIASVDGPMKNDASYVFEKVKAGLDKKQVNDFASFIAMNFREPQLVNLVSAFGGEQRKADLFYEQINGMKDNVFVSKLMDGSFYTAFRAGDTGRVDIFYQNYFFGVVERFSRIRSSLVDAYKQMRCLFAPFADKPTLERGFASLWTVKGFEEEKMIVLLGLFASGDEALTNNAKVIFQNRVRTYNDKLKRNLVAIYEKKCKEPEIAMIAQKAIALVNQVGSVTSVRSVPPVNNGQMNNPNVRNTTPTTNVNTGFASTQTQNNGTYSYSKPTQTNTAPYTNNNASGTYDMSRSYSQNKPQNTVPASTQKPQSQYPTSDNYHPQNAPAPTQTQSQPKKEEKKGGFWHNLFHRDK